MTAPKPRTLAALLVCLLACPILAGCLSSLRQPPQVQRTYLLEAHPLPGERTVTSNATLSVRSLQISPGYRTRHLLYRVGNEAFEADYYNLFLDRPQDMISDAIRRFMAVCGPFATVLPSSSTIEAEYQLEGNVVALYGDFTQSPATAVLEVECYLSHREGLDFRPLCRHSYRIEEPLTARDAEAVVAGLNKALASLLASLRAELAAKLAP